MPETVPGSGPRDPAGSLLAGFSLGIGWKEVRELERVREDIPPGTRIGLGFIDSEHTAERVEAARAAGRFGFAPVPLISARRLLSEGMLREFLAGLRAAGASEDVTVVAGDPAQPRGPYPDTVSVIGSGLLEEYGVRRVSVAGHPGGHPVIADDELWPALARKVAALRQRGLEASVTTQFGFDAGQVLTWLAGVRARGLSLPVRVGVPGPASVRRLLAYASRCGVSVSEDAARVYGLSPGDPDADVGPERFIRALAAGYDPSLHGTVKLHFFHFTGIAAMTAWITGFRRSALPARCGAPGGLPGGRGRNAGRAPG